MELKTAVLILVVALLTGCGVVPDSPKFYPPNVLVYESGETQVLSQGTVNFHGNRFTAPQTITVEAGGQKWVFNLAPAK